MSPPTPTPPRTTKAPVDVLLLAVDAETKSFGVVSSPGFGKNESPLSAFSLT